MSEKLCSGAGGGDKKQVLIYGIPAFLFFFFPSINFKAPYAEGSDYKRRSGGGVGGIEWIFIFIYFYLGSRFLLLFLQRGYWTRVGLGV